MRFFRASTVSTPMTTSHVVHRRPVEFLSAATLSAVLITVWLALFLYGPAAAAAVCPQAAGPAPPMPQVSFLRSYRMFFNSPARLAVGAGGALYITDPVTGRVVVRDHEGRVIDEHGGLGFATSVGVDPSGRVYIADAAAGNVTVYTRGWEPLFMLGLGDGEFALPGDIAFDTATGKVYVTDTNAHRVKVYGADGQWLFSFGEEGYRYGQFRHPSGIFVTADAVLVADQRNRRVQRFDLDGNFCAALGRRSLNYPQGIWVDGAGRILVADAYQGHVAVLDHDGNELGLIGSYGHARGKLRTPLDLAMDAFGRLFVSSANGARVDMFGVGAFSDPERFAPAAVQIEPRQLDRTHGAGQVAGLIEMPGYRLKASLGSLVTANGVPAEPDTSVVGDHNGNGQPDLKVYFDGNALLATLPAANMALVTVRGAVDGMQFEATDTVQMIYTAYDADRDGVLDANDLCPDSGPEETVDAVGCSVPQYCACEGPTTEAPWDNHGRYVSCVTHKAGDFARAGLIAKQERKDYVKQAAQSQCGKPNRTVQRARSKKQR